jgi:hypothetical protein
MVIPLDSESWVISTLMLGLSWITWIGWIASLFQKKSPDDFTTPLRRMLIPVFFTILSFEGYLLSDESLLHYLVTGTGIIAASIAASALLVTAVAKCTKKKRKP